MLIHPSVRGGTDLLMRSSGFCSAEKLMRCISLISVRAPPSIFMFMVSGECLRPGSPNGRSCAQTTTTYSRVPAIWGIQQLMAEQFPNNHLRGGHAFPDHIPDDAHISGGGKSRCDYLLPRC